MATTELERAYARLDAAVARLSAALASGKGDNLAAMAELGKLKAEHAELKVVASRVAHRLDGAIERLSGILGEPQAADETGRGRSTI